MWINCMEMRSCNINPTKNQSGTDMTLVVEQM